MNLSGLYTTQISKSFSPSDYGYRFVASWHFLFIRGCLSTLLKCLKVDFSSQWYFDQKDQVDCLHVGENVKWISFYIITSYNHYRRQTVDRVVSMTFVPVHEVTRTVVTTGHQQQQQLVEYKPKTKRSKWIHIRKYECGRELHSFDALNCSCKSKCSQPT